jgi:hypothetical protein
MQTLYLHIGTHKTGTTSLQNFCQLNRDWLSDKGVYYPVSPGTGHEKAAAELKEGNDSTLLRFVKEIQSSGKTAGLLSSEDFFDQAGMIGASLGEIADQVIIVAYLRRQDFFIQSLYGEVVKHPEIRSTESFETYYENAVGILTDVNHPLSWSGLLSSWTGVFPKDQVRVRVYEKNQWVGGTVISDFLSLLGLQEPSYLQHPSEDQRNISFPPLITELLRRTNHTRNHDQQERLVSRLQRYLPALEFTEKQASMSWMSSHERLDLLKRCEDVNLVVAREYLNRNGVHLFQDPFPDPHVKWEPVHVNLDELDPVLTSLFNGDGL